jgi:hypothetical protein
MAPSPSSVDPDHEFKRATISRVGVGLLAVGLPTDLVGVILFMSVFFTGLDVGPGMGPPIRPVIGLIMAGVGGFLTVFGLQALTAGNAGRILRYQLAEALPPARDAAMSFAPTAQDLARGMAGAVSQGFEEGPAPARVPHSCGAWNDPDARFCKGCGAALAAPACPKCGATLEADARFCPHCGSERPMLA